VTREHHGIRLGLHARASLRAELEAAADDVLTVTGHALDYYAELFDRPYPFGDYHQAFVPDFNAGAMENPGCVTLRDTFLHRGRTTYTDRAERAGVVAHELAHMWFGDLVTMRWWDDLWLNESFAEYLAHRCREAAMHYPLWTEFGVVRKDWGAVADQGPTTHPVAGNAAPDAETALQQFDGISYAKGAAVLRQLAAYLGEEVFVDGLRRYVRTYAWANATFPDLLACWTAAGAVDLEPWAQAWLRTSGMDTLDVSADPVAVVRRPGPGGADRPHALRVVSVAADGRTTAVGDVTLTAAPVPVDPPADSVLLVPDGLDAAWAKIRFGPDGWSRLARVLSRITDPPVQVVTVNAIRDAVRDAELDPAEALDLLLAAVPGWPDDTLVDAGLGFALGTLAGPYAPVAERPDRLRRVAGVVEEMLRVAPQRSDSQLIDFRLAVRSTADVPRLKEWAAGDRLPPGVALDPELAWLIVERLAAIDPDPGPIETALSRDRSAAARIHATRARAMLGLPEAKAATWTQLVEPSELSAYELYAAAEGFFVAGQEPLTDPYVERYFADIGGTGAFRSGWALREVAAKAYPHLAATPETVRRAEQALAGELPRVDPPGSARRHRPIVPSGALAGAIREDAVRDRLASLPAYGHLYPLLPLAQACQAAGHDVVVATGPPFLDRLPVPTTTASRLQHDRRTDRRDPIGIPRPPDRPQSGDVADVAARAGPGGWWTPRRYLHLEGAQEAAGLSSCSLRAPTIHERRLIPASVRFALVNRRPGARRHRRAGDGPCSETVRRAASARRISAVMAPIAGPRGR
jgi:aminopeptidase N